VIKPNEDYRPRTVLYLDVDDTLIDWSDWLRPRAARGAKDFLLWAMDHYEVRWLTYWAPEGRMEEDRLEQLSEILDVDTNVLRRIGGRDWSWSMDKKDGIRWKEAAVGRPFVWVEDDGEVGDNLRRKLERLGLLHCYRECNVTRDKDALVRVHEELRGEWKLQREGADGYTSEGATTSAGATARVA
jgi:hypothetical protein